MTHQFADIAFTDNVKTAQKHYGSRQQNMHLQELGSPNDQLSAREADFIEQRDTFYLATVSETGWPYVQHRGGPPGFLKVLGPNKLGYPDFRGNTQLISVGNASGNARCSLLLMDYATRKRLKILGTLSVQDVREEMDALSPKLRLPGYKVNIERMILIDVVAFDWNCPQHITQRYTVAEISEMPMFENQTNLQREG